MDYQEVKKNLSIDEIDRLNLNSSGESWANQPSSHNSQAMGNTAISVPNIPSELPEQSRPNNEQHSLTPELGQVVPTMPPGYEAEPLSESASETGSTEPHIDSSTNNQPDAKIFDRQHAMSGERLNTKTIDALQDRERQLSSDGDIASFVDFVDQARTEFQGKENA